MTGKRSRFQAIGTLWEIQIHEAVSDETWAKLLERIGGRIDSFDRTYSRFRKDSLVTNMSKAAGSYELPPDGYQLLHFYDRLYRATHGKVTPLIGQVVAAAGYDAAYSFRPKTLLRPPQWDSVLSYDKNSITLKQPALLDFGAAGKGYLVDIVSELIEQAGIGSYLINAGGDIRYRSRQLDELEVGLENPQDPSEAIGIVSLQGQSLCASAGSKRKWGDFHHIIDPVELNSPEAIVATWVIAKDTMTADGLATALFFVPADQLQHDFSFSYAVLDQSMALSYAKDFPVAVFKAA